MIRQLVQRMPHGATTTVLSADALDLGFHQAQVWDAFESTLPDRNAVSPARKSLWSMGAFAGFAPSGGPDWDHLGYSFALENTRMAQILARVVHEYRNGERLGIPSAATQRWLDTTEVLLELGLQTAWPSLASARRTPESVRRNAYWRLFGMELAFGSEGNEPFVYEKAEASNTNFVPLLEALLRAIRRGKSAPSRPRMAGEQQHARVMACVTELKSALLARRQSHLLAREELAAATVMGWLELSLQADSPVVKDLRAEADTAAARLMLVGARVGLPAHQKTEELFALAPEFSTLLRAVESDAPNDTTKQVLLADSTLAEVGHRVITHWSAATGASI